MGSVELDTHQQQLFILSNIITYGNAATPEITELIREEIETMWTKMPLFERDVTLASPIRKGYARAGWSPTHHPCQVAKC